MVDSLHVVVGGFCPHAYVTTTPQADDGRVTCIFIARDVGARARVLLECRRDPMRRSTPYTRATVSEVVHPSIAPCYRILLTWIKKDETQCARRRRKEASTEKEEEKKKP